MSLGAACVAQPIRTECTFFVSVLVPLKQHYAGPISPLLHVLLSAGGLGGEPGNEAHGGYTFCGVAALALAGRMDAIDLPRLLHWATQRQGWVEGGFNGRTNKLVDGCYSFWQGGLFSLLQRCAPDMLRQTQVCCGTDSGSGQRQYIETLFPSHIFRVIHSSADSMIIGCDFAS